MLDSVEEIASEAGSGDGVGEKHAGPDRIKEIAHQKSLLRTGALQDAIFNSANFSSIATDAKGVIQIFNVGAERMLGYTAAEVMNKITPADISDPQELIARAGALSLEFHTPITPGFEALAFKASRGIEDIYKLTYIRKDGSRFPAVVSVTALRDAQENIIGYLLIGTDNTARKQAEADRASLRASERKLAFHLMNAPIGAIEWNRDFRVVEWNLAAEQMFGYSRAEALGKHASFIVPAGLRAIVDQVWTSLLEQRGGTRSTNENVAKGGKTLSCDWFNTPLRDDQGTVFGVTSLIQDISERERAEQALRESEQRFRTMVEQSISGFYVIQDGRFAYVNSRFAEIFGYASVDEIVGKQPSELVAAKDRTTLAENLRRRLASEAKCISYSFTGICKDGTTREIGVHGSLASYQGHPAVMGLLQDISERKLAEDEIRSYVARIEQAMRSTIKVVATIGELRDPYTHGHERRVGEIAAAIGAELGLDANRIEGIRIAGYLHDVGKISVPAEILAKPTRLSKAEFDLVRDHAQQSYEILKGVEFPWPVAEAARQHHERLDGSGYPQGLKGDEIILEARVLAVADTVEAMSSHRPYRAGLGIDAALAEIEKCRGKLYDPQAVDACLRLFRDKGYRLPA